jgi:adenosine deaminase
VERFSAMQKLTREFYTRNTLVVARELLGKYLVHRLPSGEVRRGRIVDTEAYAGYHDPGSHTYHKKQKSDRTQIWYEDGGYAYVYAIYGSYVCLGLTTEPRGTAGAVLIRSLEPVDGFASFLSNAGEKEREQDKPEQFCSGPSKLCIAMQIDKQCNGLDLCGEELYVEGETEACLRVEDIVFAPRINIDYAGVGALSAWRYYLRTSPAVTKKNYEPLREWRTKGYPSFHQQQSLDLFRHLAQREEQITMKMEERSQLQALPKIELHLHLEGCVTPTTLRALCQKNRQPLPRHLQDGETHQFGTFAEFAYSYHRICQAIVQEQDLALVIADIAAYLKRNSIVYAELSWTPFLYLNRGFRFDAAMDVMNEALVSHHIADRVNFIIDVQRDHGIEVGSYVYQHVFAAREEHHIVGVGLTGQEEGFPPSEYQRLYHQARERGLGTTAHAGEYGTVDDIWQCLRALKVSRIGHGIRATDDRTLLDYLAEQHIHLETCPTSNVRLGRVMTYSGHPVQVFRQRHLSFGLNSDDPGLFASDLSDEYSKVMEHCGFSLFDIKETLEQSVVAAFLPPERKQVLLQQIDHDWRSLCSSV